MFLIIKLDSDYAMVYNNVGYIYYDQGNYTKAIQNYKKAIELDPDFTYAYNNLGNAYYDKGETDQALIYYKKAAKLGSKNAQKKLKEM